MQNRTKSGGANIFSRYLVSNSLCFGEYFSKIGMGYMENYLKAPENMAMLGTCIHRSNTEMYSDWCNNIALPFIRSLQK